MSLNGFVYKGINNLIRLINSIFHWTKYDAMRCISLIGLYSTPYYDVESMDGVFYF